MVNWDEIKRDYETSNLTLAKLAEKHSVSLGTLKSRKSRDEKAGSPWLRDELERVATEHKKVATKKRKVATKGNGASAQNDVPPEIRKVVEAFEEVTEENVDLTKGQRLFCLYYVKYMNATKAYQKAYDSTYETANTSGPRLMVNVRVRAEIARLKKERAAGILLDKEDVLQRYMDIAFADLGDYVEYGTEEVEVRDEDGYPVIKPDGEPETYTRNYVRFRDSAALDNTIISEVKQGKDGVSVKLHDKMKALDVLAKYTDLLDDRTKTRVTNEKAKTELALKQMDLEREKREQPTGTDGNKYAYMSPEERAAAIERLKGMKRNDG